MLAVIPSNKFNRSIRKIAKRNQDDAEAVKAIIKAIAAELPLESSRKDHPLKGSEKSKRECHVKNDLLLTYEINQTDGYLYLVDTGTHQDLFGK